MNAVVLLLASLLLPSAVPTFVPQGAGDAETHKQTARRMVEAVNHRDLDALDELVAADVRRHSAATPDVVVESLDQFKEFLRQDFAGVPDSEQEIGFMLAEGDLVAAHITYSGTQTGHLGPFPPTGREFSIPFIGILRFDDDGKIVEMWVEWDNLNLLSQLGHFPPGEQ